MIKVMIVDDDPETTSILSVLLKREGFMPIAVNDSTLAVEKALAIQPDIFLLDLMMPVVDGFKLCRLLRAEQDFERTPILIVTALSTADSRVVAFGAGANDYITKPYHPHNLMLKVKALLLLAAYEQDDQADDI